VTLPPARAPSTSTEVPWNRTEPETQPSWVVVLRMLRTRNVTGPFRRPSVLEAVPVYVAEVS
jgi:hypothetical protein